MALGLAAAMMEMPSMDFDLPEATYSGKKVSPKTLLTNKQKKRRAANKIAKQSRKRNR